VGEKTASGTGLPFRGGRADGAEDEWDPGEGQKVRDEAGDLRTQSVAVVEGAVRKARQDAGRLYRVAEGAQAQERENSPLRA
jgi:hypothetical protein